MTRGVARIPAPEEWVRKATCRRCDATKPWAKFPARVWWPDGTVRRVETLCSTCDAERQRDRQRKLRSERSEQFLRHEQYRREWQRRKRREVVADRSTARNGNRLPVEPTREFLRTQMKDHDMTILELADICGLPERAIRRVLGEHAHVSLRVADTVATQLGAHLYDLYPELMEEAA